MVPTLPDAITNKILHECFDCMSTLCSLTAMWVLRAFGVDNEFLSTYPILNVRSLHELERARRLGQRYRDLYLRSIPWKAGTLIVHRRDGGVVRIDVETCSLRRLAVALWNGVSASVGGHPIFTFCQWLGTESAHEQYEWIVLGTRYAAHRRRKIRRMQSSSYAYESSSDSGSEWYQSDAEDCIVMHEMQGSSKRCIKSDLKLLRSGCPLHLRGRDKATVSYARELRDAVNDECSGLRHRTMILPSPRARKG